MMTPGPHLSMSGDEYEIAVSEALARLAEMLDHHDAINEKRIRDIIDCLHGKVRGTDFDAHKYDYSKLDRELLEAMKVREDAHTAARETLMKSMTDQFRTVYDTKSLPSLSKESEAGYTYHFSKYPPNNSGDIRTSEA